MLTKSLLPLFVLVLATPSFGSQPPDNVAEAGNRFGLQLYRQLSDQEGNLFISPTSIHTALAMAYGGAKKRTADEMGSVLHIGHLPAAHDDFARLLEQLRDVKMVSSFELRDSGVEKTTNPAYQLMIANALWGQQGAVWQPDFLSLTAEQYQAGLFGVDFIKDSEASRTTINQWIDQKTKGKITNLIAPGVLNAMTRLVLTNAVYFKARWAKKFMVEQTGNRPFHLTMSEKVQVPMMTQTDGFRYMETASAQVLELGYTAGELAMIVILPKKVDGLAQLEKTLDVDTIDHWLNQLRPEEVKVTLPKFEYSSGFSLATRLKGMGMVDAFSAEDADFSGISDQESLYLSNVIHKAFVAVDEEGTEAAAATALVMAATAAPMPKPEPRVFTADHPFFFVIRHRATNALLFMGRVVAP